MKILSGFFIGDTRYYRAGTSRRPSGTANGRSSTVNRVFSGIGHELAASLLSRYAVGSSPAASGLKIGTNAALDLSALAIADRPAKLIPSPVAGSSRLLETEDALPLDAVLAFIRVNTGLAFYVYFMCGFSVEGVKFNSVMFDSSNKTLTFTLLPGHS